MTKTEHPRGFSRRNFIKGAAVLTASGAIAGCSPQGENLSETGGEAPEPQVEADQIYSGVCRGNCAGGCFLNIHVRDGQIVRTTARDMPDPRYTRICSKGLTQVARVYSSKRLQYPMKRVGERGAGEFERISWDEALDTIAEKWTGYREEFGNDSVALYLFSGNFGLLGRGSGSEGPVSLFQNVMGMSFVDPDTDAANAYVYGAITGYTPYANANEPVDWLNAKTIVCWGANPAISMPHVMHIISEARENGTKYIVIDPVYNANASKADWHIPIKATTDGALAMGVINYIFQQGWQKDEYLAAKTESAFLVRQDSESFLRLSDIDSSVEAGSEEDVPLVMNADSRNPEPHTTVANVQLYGVSEVNGIQVKTAIDIMKEAVAPYTTSYVSQLTGLSEEDIAELARVYAQDGPVYTHSMFGMNHYVNAQYNFWPVYALGVITGQYGQPGGGGGMGELLANFVLNNAPSSPEGALGSSTHLKVNKLLDIIETGKLNGEDFPLKSVFITFCNAASTMADHGYTDKWLKAIDFVVVADITMSETAKYADILLPAAHWFEQEDLFVACASHPYFLKQEKAIEPLYESKSDFDILALLAERMGLGEYFKMTPSEFIEASVDSEALKAMGSTYEKLEREGAIRALPGECFVAYGDGSFTTPSGKAVMYKEAPMPDYDSGQEIDLSKERTLYWEPAHEATETCAVREKHPFHVISEHMRTRTHSQWWDVDYLKEYEPEPLVKMNPDDALELGLEDGDTVRIFNDRGEATLKVYLHAGCPPKTLLAPRSYQAEEYISGHLASLCHNVYNQMCANQGFNDVAVSIEKN